MHPLDDLKRVKRLDPDNVLESIGLLSDQLSQVFSEFKKVKIPTDLKSVEKIVHSGMGGSALGADMIQSVYFDELKKPFQIISGYKVPAIVDNKTLYVLTSYSGSTEESLLTVTAAKKAGAKIFGIAAGADIGRLVKQGELPGYIFDPLANPSNQPRIGVGYTLAAEIALLRRLGFIKLTDGQVKKTLNFVKSLNKKFGFENPHAKNQAKQLAEKIKSCSLRIVASEHLAGSAHAFANQANETGKTLSAYHLISEMNHHLLEGLKFPDSNKRSLFFIFLESKLYHPKNQVRYKITQDVVKKNKVKYASYKTTAGDKLTQALETLVFSSYVTFYLAMLNNIDPSLIPWVDYFKAQLKKDK